MKNCFRKNAHEKVYFLLFLLCFIVQIQYADSLFSRYHRKCRLFVNHTGTDIGQLQEERLAFYEEDFYFEPLIETRKRLQNTEFDYIYIEYIGAGGSGEVYLVEDLSDNKPKVLKRFFKEKIPEFEEENFIMNHLNYSVKWTKDFENGVPVKTDYEKDVNSHTKVPTMAIYPSKESIVLREVEFYEREAPILFYKILRELHKTHKNSIVHNDLKLGNILVNSLGSDFKLFETQLIDWNLASFFYKGYESNEKKGTACYYSPQQLMRSYHITPAIDVWALGVVMFTFYTDKKPYYEDCKNHNLKAIASLVGVEKILKMQKKYRFSIQKQVYELMEEYESDPTIYPGKSLKGLVPKDRQEAVTDELLDIFERMLTPDPEDRITLTELLNHDYFKKAKKIPPMFYEKRKSEEGKKKGKSPHGSQNQHHGSQQKMIHAK